MLYPSSNPLFQAGALGSEIASLRASRLVAPVPYANYFYAEREGQTNSKRETEVGGCLQRMSPPAEYYNTGALPQTPPLCAGYSEGHPARASLASDDAFYPSRRRSEAANYTANCANHLAKEVLSDLGYGHVEDAYEIKPAENAALMRSRYCVKYELGLCPKLRPSQKAKEPLYLVNAGRKLKLSFDCKRCEMVVSILMDLPSHN